jgi:hypothetical protein
VFIDGAWYPLSEAGLYTYAHSSGLVFGDRYRFVRADGSWGGEIYEVELADALEGGAVGEWYGHEAELRSFSDYPTVQLRLRRVQ